MVAPRVLGPNELEAIAGGALPSAARRRLEELAGIDGMSTSFLSAAESSLAGGLGVTVLGQVVGCCAGSLRLGVIRAVGPGSEARHKPGAARWLERSGVVETWTTARLRAVSRIQEQAAILGADAVVGVRATRRQLEFVAEVVLTGTAVRTGPQAPAPGARPLVTRASVAELAKLRACGADPVGLVGGCASVAAVPSSATTRALRRRRRRRPSQELDEFSFAFGETRRRAVARLRTEAAGSGARGVIGIELDDLEAFRGGGGDYHVVLHLLGTAVRRPPAVEREPVGVTLRTGSGAG
ncbi:MAG TPA: heavy metal-binding domain-containing protein [Solirubrobacteraceae bacterium]